MSLPKERISFLLEAYTSKTATAQQEQELMEWIHEAHEDTELKNYMQSLWDKYQPESDRNNVNWNRMFEDIMQKEKVHSIVPEPKRINWARVAAAAVIVLLLSVGGYFIFSNRTQKQIAKTVPIVSGIKNDIAAPQSNKAVLTLSDGSTIVLDSAGNGSLAVQGNVNVVKTADGLIEYDALRQAQGDNEIKFNTLTVPRGSKPVQLQLADGSNVWLNVASSITYPTAFISKERKVQVTGEAYFEVAPLTPKGGQGKVPFIVKFDTPLGDGGSVQVLGTHFNVNTYDDETSMKITLIEGSVKVTPPSPKGGYAILKPGQQAQVTPLGDGGIMVQTANIDEVMAWKNGLFSLNKTDMQTFMRMISRWYDVDVVYEGGIPKGTISGEAQRSLSFSQMQKVLQLTDIHFRIEGKRMIITH